MYIGHSALICRDQLIGPRPYAPAMEPARREIQLGASLFPALALVLLAGSGLLLASSWFIGYSAPVLSTAWGVAITAAITVVTSGWREARRMGIGYLGSLGASMKRLGRFAVDFF